LDEILLTQIMKGKSKCTCVKKKENKNNTPKFLFIEDLPHGEIELEVK